MLDDIDLKMNYAVFLKSRNIEYTHRWTSFTRRSVEALIALKRTKKVTSSSTYKRRPLTRETNKKIKLNLFTLTAR